MISVPNIIKAWQERLDDYTEESMIPKLIRDTIAALELLEKQNEVITELRKLGYPHGFEQEKPWIVDYMHLITEVVKKAVKIDADVANQKEMV